MDRLILHQEGGEPAALELTHERLFDAPESEQVPDIGALIPGRRGRGVRFSWIVSLAAPKDALTFVPLESKDGRFAAQFTRKATLQLEPIVDEDDAGIFLRVGGTKVHPPAVDDPLKT